MVKCIILILSVFASCFSNAFTLDERLDHIIDTFQLKASSCGTTDPRIVDDNLVSLGDFLFNTKLLSGDNDTSCATCHLDAKHLTDGLPVAVGVGGDGDGIERMSSNGGVIVARNAFTLFSRSHPEFNTFFWDGKVIEQDGLIYSPIGEGFSKGFNSAFSLAAVLPILARDEFLGEQRTYGSSRNLELINSVYFDQKFEAANLLLDELLVFNTAEKERLIELKNEANITKLDLAAVGNAITAFLANKIDEECLVSSWDKYLLGDKQALTREQKYGANLFFGKGRCAACHNGSLFSDMKFHSVGVPQGDFGTHLHGQDIGRAGITFQETDRYKFRTPPLIGVSKTAPYGHNGVFKDLQSAILFHVNPIPFFTEEGWTSERELLTYGKLLGARSAILQYIDLQSEDQISAIVLFLESL